MTRREKQAEPAADLLQERVAALKVLSLRRPRPDRLREVRDALNDKFEGVQGAALKVLGTWGDAPSLAVLKTFFAKAFETPQARAIRSAAIKALLPHVGGGDADFLLDLYSRLEGVSAKHEVFPLVLALPPDAARKRLIKMLRDADPANRQAAVKAIGNMAYADRRALIAPLENDPDDFVASSARMLVG